MTAPAPTHVPYTNNAMKRLSTTTLTTTTTTTTAPPVNTGMCHTDGNGHSSTLVDTSSHTTTLSATTTHRPKTMFRTVTTTFTAAPDTSSDNHHHPTNTVLSGNVNLNNDPGLAVMGFAVHPGPDLTAADCFNLRLGVYDTLDNVLGSSSEHVYDTPEGVYGKTVQEGLYDTPEGVYTSSNTPTCDVTGQRTSSDEWIVVNDSNSSQLQTITSYGTFYQRYYQQQQPTETKKRPRSNLTNVTITKDTPEDLVIDSLIESMGYGYENQRAPPPGASPPKGPKKPMPPIDDDAMSFFDMMNAFNTPAAQPALR